MHSISDVYKKLVTGCFWIVLVSLSPALHAQSGCWRLVWSDEFETGEAPDGKKWSYETGGGGWGNNEVQFYTATRNNSYVSNGTLKIHAKKSESGIWTSARLVTRGKATWKYGRFEIRAKLPAGRGTWPAIWMMPQQSVYGSWPKSGEIDIMEHVGYEMNRVYGTVHTEAYNHSLGTQKGGNMLLTGVDTEFYTYTIEWSDSRIKWLVNDRPVYAFYNENKTYKEWPFDQAFFLIMNIAIGGSWGGSKGIDPDLTEAGMEIDYVRVYTQEIAIPQVSGPGYVTSGQPASFSTPLVEGLSYRWILPGGVIPVTGTASNTISVIWNDKPGQISVEAFHSCDTVTSTLFPVKPVMKPSGEYWQVPVVDPENKLLWTAEPGSGNQINIRYENGELIVSYNIQNPENNPGIRLDLPVVTDLTNHRECRVMLMAATGTMLSGLKIYLNDIDGKTGPNDLFPVDNPPNDGQYHSYMKTFAMDAAGGWQPSRIAVIRVVFNFGEPGNKGAGEFRLKNLTLHDLNFTRSSMNTRQDDLILYPNPADDEVSIVSTEPFSEVGLISLSGTVLKRVAAIPALRQVFPLNNLPSGFYFLYIQDQQNRIRMQKLIKK